MIPSQGPRLWSPPRVPAYDPLPGSPPMISSQGLCLWSPPRVPAYDPLPGSTPMIPPRLPAYDTLPGSPPMIPPRVPAYDPLPGSLPMIPSQGTYLCTAHGTCLCNHSPLPQIPCLYKISSVMFTVICNASSQQSLLFVFLLLVCVDDPCVSYTWVVSQDIPAVWHNGLPSKGW